MTKKDYEKLALACRKMRDGVRTAQRDGEPSTDQIMEIVIAQLGLVLAADNPNFDSFIFAAMCKGSKP